MIPLVGIVRDCLIVGAVGYLLLGCDALTQQADCAAAQKDGKTMLCCPVGFQPGTLAPQWRCAWVHKITEG